MKLWGLISVLMILTASTADAQGGRTVSIDLLAGTIDGRKFSIFTVDELTDILGRPSAVQHSPLGTDSPWVHYHDVGLSFWFSSREKGERIIVVDIHLSKSWDKTFMKHYQAFTGQLTPGR